MVMRNVQIPYYQAKLPIRGGGGVSRIDTSERPQENPIVAALERILARKRQTEMDELARQKAAEQPKGRIVVGGGTTWLVNPQTGEKTDLGIPAPKGEASSALINAWRMLGQYEQPTPEEEAIRGAMGQSLMGQYGLEQVEEKVPGTKRTWGWPTLTKPAYRVRPERTETRKVIRKKTPITEALEKTETKGKEPATIKEFETEVARLKKTDMKAAKAYYDKWAGKWQ